MNQYKDFAPAFFRQHLEETFYQRIARQARIDQLRKDPEFLKNPIKHQGLYTDHGPVHVRDVAERSLQVIDQVNGLLIPRRINQDLAFMRALTVHLTFLHDIGMADFTPYGRFMHPEFAAHYVYQPVFDEILDRLWAENSGNIPWQLLHVFGESQNTETLKRIFRELLSLSVAHSKSKVPIDLLNDAPRFRRHMIRLISHPLPMLYTQQMSDRLERKLNNPDAPTAKRKGWSKDLKRFQEKLAEMDITGNPAGRLDDDPGLAFDWLEKTEPLVLRLIANVQDSLRCLRAADALRQRGTTLRTSAGYEIFVDQTSAHAIFALRGHDQQELFLLEGKKALNAGEANVAGSEIDPKGNLHISFHRGAFRTPKANRRAIRNASIVIEDIQADVIDSFRRAQTQADQLFQSPPARSAGDVYLVVEGVHDNPRFAKDVAAALAERIPHMADRITTGVSLQGADLYEVNRYQEGTDFQDRFSASEQLEWQDKIAGTQVYAHIVDDKEAFEDVRVVTVEPGEILIRAGSPAGFVYIPFCDGLEVLPLGGYRHQPAAALLPLGNTGVVRGADRNAEVRSRREAELLAIPRQRYLEHWHQPISGKQLAAMWQKK